MIFGKQVNINTGNMENGYCDRVKKITSLFLFIAFLFFSEAQAQIQLSTDYFKISINKKGFITSMKNITKIPNQEFRPADKPSPCR